MNHITILLLLVFITACSKDDNSTFSEAKYRVTVTGKWSAPSFGVPAGPHFTTFAGMVHHKDISLWKDGNLASPGIEMVAEIGNLVTLFSEIDSKIAEGKASSLLAFVAPEATGTVHTNLYTNTNYTSVSFASMIAPSPDWFIGVSGIELYSDGKWIADTTVQLYPYDAGTEEGDVFNTNNPPTTPQQLIHKLTVNQATVLANGNPGLGPIATVRFTKL